MQTIVVINPNSTEAVTEGIDRALEPLRLEGGPPIECLTMREGPPGIETAQQAEAVVEPLCRLIGARGEDVGAFVIACYSDPGLEAARGLTSSPVFGIGESAMLAALTRGERFGVISILEPSVERHLAYVQRLGLSERLADDRAIGVGVQDLASEDTVLSKMAEVGARLRDTDGADVLIMGCAGMARYRERLEAGLGLPVIDPCQAAATLALGSVLLRAR